MRKICSKNRRLSVLCVLLVLTAGAGALLVFAFHRLPDYSHAITDRRLACGTVVIDRNGKVLRVFPDADEQLSLWQKSERIPDRVKLAFIAAEDQRFFSHPGFDPIAIVRAAITNITRGKTVSGASTISQQVIRLLKPRPRTWRGKIVELLESAKMEVQLSKDEILELYLNLAPMAGNLRGVGIAARTYFGKDINRITVAEAALLAALPRSPSRYDLRRGHGRDAASTRKDVILKRMARNGWIGEGDLKVMLAADVKIEANALPMEAPHFVDFVMSRKEGKGPLVGTTLDQQLQRFLEKTLKSHQKRLADMGIRQAGAIVVSIPNAEILAMVGSLGYEASNQGYNNGVLSSRGVGSTLKPFLYALALEQGLNAVAEIPDTFRSYPTPQGDYLPLNADRRSYGPVTMRSALGNSLNLSAVKTVQSVGIGAFYKFLMQLDIVDDRMPPAEHYGLGLAVGNIETSLFRLVQAYTALAGEGLHRSLVAERGETSTETRCLPPEAAYVINHILADHSARLLTFGNPGYLDFPVPVCVKTGTSTNYRDNWIIGYTPRHIIGIWAGNFSGNPSRGATGAGSCGPILREVVDHLYAAGPPGHFKKPPRVWEDSICWMSGKRASPNCPYATKELFIADAAAADRCDLSHEPEQFYYLGGAYARWVHRREMEQGTGRFRLITGDRPPPVSHTPGYSGSISRDRPPPISDHKSITIVSPHDADHFVTSPHMKLRVRLHAVANPIVSHLTWLVDGIEVAKTKPPYEFFWEPTRGRHVIHAVTPDMEAAQVAVMVE